MAMCERVRCVGGGIGGERQQRANHLGHLVLTGLPAARHGPLHPRGRIFVDRHPSPREGEQHDPTRVTELRGGLRVLMEEQRFDGRRLGTKRSITSTSPISICWRRSGSGAFASSFRTP